MAPPRLSAALQEIRRAVVPCHREERPDRQLLHDFVSRHDEAAFASLVRRHGPLVLRVCRQVAHHAQDAEDAFQATFLALARQAASIRAGEALGGWLHKVAFHVASKARRGAARRRVHEGRVRPVAPDIVTQELSWREVQEVLHEEIQRLPGTLRAPFVLCVLEGKSRPEAARQLGWKEGTVSGRLARARERLRRQLTRRDVTLSAGLAALAVAGGEGTAAESAALIASTVKAAIQVAGGTPAAVAAGSARVGALADGAARTVPAAKLKAAAALLLAGLLVAGTTFLVPADAQVPPAGLPVNPVEAAGVEEKPERVDGHGDPLPAGALARFGTLRLVQGGRAYHMALSPDGKLLAAGDEHGKLRIWDTSTGKELRALDCKEYIGAVAFIPGPAGLCVAAGTNAGRLRVWELQSGKLVLEAKYPSEEREGATNMWTGLSALAASPDGKLLAVGGEYKIHLWDLAGGKELRHWAAHRSGVTSLHFTPDGKGLLSGGRNHEIITGGGFRMVRPTWPHVGCALALWDPATGKLQKKFAEQTTASRVLGFTADGRSWGSVGSSGTDGYEFRLWDMDLKSRAVVPLKDLQYSIGAAALSPDGKTLAVNYAQTIGLWDVASGRRLKGLKDERDYYTFDLAFLPDGRTLAASPGTTRARFWDLATGKPRHTFAAHERGIWALAVAPDGKTAVTGGLDGQVREWDVATGKPLRAFHPVPPPVTYIGALRYAPDGKTLACGFSAGISGGISLWDTARGERVGIIPGPPGQHSVRSVTFSPDGKTLAYQGINDKVLRLWDLRAGKEVRQFPQGEGGTNGLAYSPWGEWIASTVSDRLTLWDAVTGREMYRKKLSGYEVTFSPDGLLLGMYYEPTRIFEAGPGTELMKIPTRVNYSGSSLAFSPDGRHVAVTKGENIEIWDILAGKLVHTFRGHRSWGMTVAFTPDGKRLISGAEDTTALVWDMSVVPEEKLPAPDWATLWDALKSEDRRAAYTALWHMRRAPGRAVALLDQHMRRVPAVDPGQLERLLKDLDAPVFAVREKATDELRRTGDADHVARRLNEYAKEPLPLEVRRRLERVLPKAGGALETRRLLWGLRLLEMIGTEEALALLRRMAGGDPASPVTRQARAALTRQGKTAQR